MIREFIEYWFTSSQPWGRARGLVYESVAIGARFRRQKKSWSQHLENSKKEIRNFVKTHSECKRILVLGSGHLFDFPTDLFSQLPDVQFGLVDAVHPPSTSKWARQHSNLQLIKQDIVYLWGQDSKVHITDWDLVISSCVASQLPLSLSESEQRSCEIVQAHFENLKKSNKKFLIITDFRRHYLSQAKTAVRPPDDTVFGAPAVQNPKVEWNWDLAPIGEVSRDYSIQLTVGVWSS